MPTLLIVDDDRNTREGYQMYLSAKGFKVLGLEGGVDALEFAKSSTPDLVILDLGLPDIDGWEVARRLKSDEHTRDIPIIAFSGRSMQHEQVSALRAGCDVYLVKPCAPARLLDAVHKLLGLDLQPSTEKEAQRDPY
jgi:two-component system alkaline phosphatase synthesis response regulator PhoP